VRIVVAALIAFVVALGLVRPAGAFEPDSPGTTTTSILDNLRACIRDLLLPASQHATILNAPGNAKVAAYRPVVGRSSVKFHRTFMTRGRLAF